ncbi:MAG: glycosyltransferase family 4 protein [Anaerolineaceae bacterium]
MKIAYIATSSIPSSTANSIQVMKVCQALTQQGHEVHLLIPGSGDLNWDELTRQYGLTNRFPITRISSVKALKRFDFIFKALELAKTLKTDAVYTRMLWVAVIAQLRHVPVMLELHDVPAGRLGKPLFLRYLKSNSKKLTVMITNALSKVIEKRFEISIPEKSRVIAPDGVDDARYKDLPQPVEARRQLVLEEGLTAVYTGGFYKGRGLELLVDLAREFPQVQFLWVGGKPEAVAGWKTVIDNLNLNNIQLTGFIPNEQLPLYQAAGEILLMPFGKSVSGSSGGNTADVCSPLKMFEYMAAGRAILTSDLPVLREVLNENNALFYAIEDFDDLKTKFTMLLSDAELRDKLSRQARTDVAQYTWQKRMQKIVERFTEDL